MRIEPEDFPAIDSRNAEIRRTAEVIFIDCSGMKCPECGTLSLSRITYRSSTFPRAPFRVLRCSACSFELSGCHPDVPVSDPEWPSLAFPEAVATRVFARFST
jgi:hypothetical protein